MHNVKSLLLLGIVVMLLGAPVLALAQTPEVPAQVEMDIDVDDDDAAAWYVNPFWLAVAVIGLVVLVLLVALAARGGSSTVVTR